MRVSAETLNRGWVGMGEWARVVGDWVVIGCVVLPLFLGSLSLVGDLAWWAGGSRSVGVDWWVSGLLGASFYHHQHHPPPTVPC